MQTEHNPEGQPPRRKWTRKRVLKWVAGGGAALVLLATVAVLLLNAFAGPIVRGRLVTFLQERYRADVEIAELRIKLLPQLHVAADRVVIRRRDQPAGMPPFIGIGELNLYGGLLGLLREAPHLERIELKGLEINIPPRKEKPPAENQASKPDDQPQEQRAEGTAQDVPDVIVKKIIADGAILRVHSRKPGKEPLQFTIRRLAMESVGINEPMSFKARLDNATPPGLIDSEGHFGPWNADDPGATSVGGSYKFRDADLSVFKGVSGTLASDGTYGGMLRRLEVDGWTDVPDFALGISGNQVPLRTDFHAVVDATDGDVRLVPVQIRLPNSTLVANGSIANRPGPDGKPTKGKTISLHVTANGARMEDLMRLAMKAEPPLTGSIHLNMDFELPPGDRDVSEKLYLKGNFALNSARFRNRGVQDKIRTLSLRGRGINKKEEAGEAGGRVVSNLKGRFLLENGHMSLPNVSFQVPGAEVLLGGTYGLRSEAMSFKGELRLDHKISETTDGIKSVLLKAVDPLFRKDGAGAVIPIHIEGTRDKPDFGVDMGRVLPFGSKSARE